MDQVINIGTSPPLPNLVAHWRYVVKFCSVWRNARPRRELVYTNVVVNSLKSLKNQNPPGSAHANPRLTARVRPNDPGGHAAVSAHPKGVAITALPAM